MSRAAKWLWWTGGTLLGSVVLLVLAIVWTLNTASGTRWIVNTAVGALDGKLAVGAVRGTVSGPLELENVTYVDPVAGIDLRVRRVDLDIALMALFKMTVDVVNAEIDGLRVTLLPTEPKPEPAEPSQPFTLEPPIEVVVRQFTLTDAEIASDAQPLVTINRAEVRAYWLNEGIHVEQLDVRSPQGQVQFAGQVAQGEHITGNGSGQFRWRVGEQEYAGALESQADAQLAQLQLRLTRPLEAQLVGTVGQTDALPWSIDIQVPRFDPRERLMPGTSLQSLAVALHGEGTQAGGALRGQVSINDQDLMLDSLRAAYDGERVRIDELLARIGEASAAFRAHGEVLLTQEPVIADVTANWDLLTVPAEWVGQTLQTQGRLEFSGSAEQFSARGDVKLGPPEQLAQIDLHVEGTPQRIAVERLAVVQPQGELSATGTVNLDPAIQWELTAQAQRFDPGAFIADWPGSINLALTTTGDIVDGAPEAQLSLQRLNGELRHRPLAGQGELQLSRERVLSGQLALSSGSSRIEVRGAAGDAMDASARVRVPALGDWLPDAEGELRADITARGSWPALDIHVDANGAGVRVAGIQIAAFEVNADVHDPTDPSGSARIGLRELTAAGMNFSRMEVVASGNQAQHELSLNSAGVPLGAEFRVRGGATEAGWSGAIEQLVADVDRVARLALERPVEVVLDTGAVRLSEACLSDDQIRLCAAGATQADGALQATYSLQGVPLSLAKLYVPEELALNLSGTIEGEGEVQRHANGELHGSARIASSQGRISQQGDSDEDQLLLEYRNFLVQVALNGTQARATLSTDINEDGTVRGEVNLVGLGEATTSLQGEAKAVFPSLASVSMFVPQLVDVQGRAELSVAASGTLDAPQIVGELLASDLGAHIPDLGLTLREGQIRVAPQSNGDVLLEGQIASGPGRVSFDGRMAADGAVNVKLQGQEFLAADIPAARVFIDPDLTLTRDDAKMAVTGTVTIPRAAIDVSKLPQSGPQARRASSDVVVVDDPVVEAEAEESGPPLTAEVTVALGEQVQIVGFGLDSTVRGRLTVFEKPGTQTTASGDISIGGTYKAYGQDLTIREGRVLYAGTPVDNPRLSIVAVRVIEDVTAGLRISGTAQAPQLTVFSDPAMGQAEALAYLVTGKPLDSVGSEDGDMMQNAARSLGTAAGGLLAKRLGSRLGVDEVSIKDDEMLNGAAFTVGQYLSPRLYLSYGVGLFEPGEVITLRYSLTKALALQALRGPQDTRAGVIFRIEK